MDRTKPWMVLCMGLLQLLAAGCGSTAPLAAESQSHHTADGFRNSHPTETPGRSLSRGSFWKWQWERWRDGLPREVPGGWHPPVLKPDGARFAARGPEPLVAWIGHATLLLSIGGTTVLTDPQFSPRASPLSFVGPERRVPPALSLAELPAIDVVVITHNHYDHLDRESVLALNRQPGGPPRFFVPLGLKAWMAGQGISNVVELDWWEQSAWRGLTMTLVPAQHFSARSPFDTNATLWGGWIVDHPSFRFYIAGDTGYSEDFREIGRRFGPIDLAAIPIGAYEPRWFMGQMHVNPEEAVQVHLDVRARASVAMHWGTFPMTDESLDEPPRALAQALARAHVSPESFFTMQFGAVRTLPMHQPAAAARLEPSRAAARR